MNTSQHFNECHKVSIKFLLIELFANEFERFIFKICDTYIDVEVMHFPFNYSWLIRRT